MWLKVIRSLSLSAAHSKASPTGPTKNLSVFLYPLASIEIFVFFDQLKKKKEHEERVCVGEREREREWKGFKKLTFDGRMFELDE